MFRNSTFSTACFCFTKLLKPFSVRWHSLDHNCFIHIDDGTSGHRLSALVIIASSSQKLDLTIAGFILAKSVNGSLIKLAFWVGLIVDLSNLNLEFQIENERNCILSLITS